MDELTTMQDATVEVGIDVADVTIHLFLRMVRENEDCSFDYNTAIDEVGQIVLTPVDEKTSFTLAEKVTTGDLRDHIDGNVRTLVLTIKSTMTTEDGNLDFFTGIDDIGQAVVTPDSEKSSFQTLVEGDSLNLVVSTDEEPVDESLTAGLALAGAGIGAGVGLGIVGAGAVQSLLDDVDRDETKEPLTEDDDEKTDEPVNDEQPEEPADAANEIPEVEAEVLNEASLEVGSEEYKTQLELAKTCFDDGVAAITNAIEKFRRLEDYFNRLNLTAVDIDRTFVIKLEDLIDEKYTEELVSQFTLAEPVIESVEEEVPNPSWNDRTISEIIHRFMSGNIDIETAMSASDDWYEVKQLKYYYEDTTYRYFYDPESDTIIEVKE